MLKINRRTVPLALEGELNRTKAELAEARGLGEARPFAAKKNYQVGEIIANGGRVFTATQAIARGETAVPGANCTETTMESIINEMQKGEE